MHLHLYCPDCLAELAEERKEVDNPEPIISIISELNEDGIYPITCNKGHKGNVVLNNMKFELLFDLGINAIIDGYYRDAVSSTTSALERYFEFFIKVIWSVKGCKEELITKIWKKMSNQSERQLGAYIALFTENFTNEPPLLGDKDINFRNSVIHKGVIPKREEAIFYANTVLELIEKSLLLLKSRYPETVRFVYDYNLPKYQSGTRGENTLTINELTIISVMFGRESDTNDKRNGNVESQLERIINDRGDTRLRLVNTMLSD